MWCHVIKRKKQNKEQTHHNSIFEGLVTSKAHFLPKDHELPGTCLAVHSPQFFYLCVILKVQLSQGFYFHRKLSSRKSYVLGWREYGTIIKEWTIAFQPPANSRLPVGLCRASWAQTYFTQQTLELHREWDPEKSTCWFFWLEKHLGCWHTAEPSSCCSRGPPHPVRGHTQKCSSEQCLDIDPQCARSLSGKVWCHQGSSCVDRWRSLVSDI